MAPDFKLPANLTLDMIMDAVKEDEYFGFCVSCGEQMNPVEPDAREYECEACGEHTVYGAEELLIMFG